MRFRPLHDRAPVRRLDEEERTAGGIIIPDTAKEKPTEACVVAVRPGVPGKEGKILPMSVNVGDHVLVGKWSGTDVTIDQAELLILKEEDILGVINAVEASAKAA